MPNLDRLVIKRFPENRDMQLVCLRVTTAVACCRCHKTQKTRLTAVVSGDWDQLLCEECYRQRLAEPPPPPPPQPAPSEDDDDSGPWPSR